MQNFQCTKLVSKWCEIAPRLFLFLFLGSEVPLAAHVLLITTQQVLEPGRKKNNTARRKKNIRKTSRIMLREQILEPTCPKVVQNG